jgi:hypothetical protein
MPIGIGLNENVYISDISQDTQSSAILITFKEVGAEVSGEFDYFTALGSEKVVEVDNGTVLRLFAPNEPKADLTEEKRINFAYNDVNGTKAVIEHIMKGYMAADQAAIGMKLYDNTGIEQDNFKQKIVQKPILLAVHNNLYRHFISGMKEFLNKTDLLFRLLLIRQSTDKAFPTFRRRFLEEQPFWEPMEVAKESSKLWRPIKTGDIITGYEPAFTKYEIDNKLNSSEPAPTKDKADKPAATATPVSASSVFG